MRNAWFEMLDPDGFKHSGDRKIRLYKGGFFGNPGKSISKFVKDPIGSVGGLFEDTVEDVSREVGNFGSSVSHELAGLDDAVNENLPGGWLLPIVVVAAYYGVPPEMFEGLTTTATATEAGVAAGGAGAAGGASASTAFWQATLQGLVDMGVPWEIASALPAAASAAGTSSLISGVQAALTGQDVFKAAVTGGVFSLAGGTIANSLINAGVNATIAQAAAQASVQAMRNGKIDLQSIALSAAMNQVNPQVAKFLNEQGIPKELIPTAMGAFNQALLTGEVDPAKLAAQATGQFVKGSWDSVKNDLKDNPTPAPIEDRFVGSKEYQETQSEYKQAVQELLSKQADFDKDKDSYQSVRDQIGKIDEQYQPIVAEKNSYIDERNALAERYDTYDARKAEFETPVSTGSDENFGLNIIEMGDDDNPRIYGDAKGGSYILSRNGEGDTYMRRIDSAFPEDKDQIYNQAVALKEKIDALTVKANELKTNAEPLISQATDLWKTITTKDAELSKLADNIYTPKDGNLAQKMQEVNTQQQATYDAWLKEQAETTRVAEEKRVAEIDRLKQVEVQRQAEAEIQRQAQETQRQAEIQLQAQEKQREAEAEVRKQTELAEFARLAKEGADQARAEEAARVAREEAQRQSQIAAEAERQRVASEVEMQRQAEIQRQTEATSVAEMNRLRIAAEENENARIRDEEQKRIANENKIQEDKDAAEKQRIAELAITNAEKNADKYAAINSGTTTATGDDPFKKFGGLDPVKDTIVNIYDLGNGNTSLYISRENPDDPSKPFGYSATYNNNDLTKPTHYTTETSEGGLRVVDSGPDNGGYPKFGNDSSSSSGVENNTKTETTETSNLPTETTETPVKPNIPVSSDTTEEYASPLDVSKKPEVTPNIPTTTTTPTIAPTTEPTTTPTTEPTSNLPVSSTQPTDNTKTPTEPATTPTNGLPVKSDTPSNVVPALGTPVGSDTSGIPVFKNPESPTGFSYSDGIPAVDPSSKTGGSGTSSPLIVPTIGKIGEYAGTDSGGISVYTNPTSPSGFSYSDGNPAAPPESSQPSSSVDSTDTTSSGGGNLPVTTPNGAGDVTTPNDGKSSVTSPSDGGSTVTTPSGGGGLPVTEPNGGIFVPYGGTEGDGTNPTVTNPIDVPLIPDDTVEVPESPDTISTECAAGFHDDGFGFCVPDETTVDPTACPEGYLWDGNACVPVNNSPATGTGTYKLPTSGSSGSSGSTAGGSAFPSSSAKTSEPTYPDPSKRGFLSPNLIKGQGGDIQLYSGLPSNLINIPFKKEGGEVEGLHPDLINILMKRGVSFTPGPEDRLYARHPTRGFAVGGAGTGQSDDIPTMLSDGEYVIDADTVAALGDGSSKAGALALDKMREEIRKHKRSAPTDKIPPKAKSPLEYLNLSRRKKHG